MAAEESRVKLHYIFRVDKFVFNAIKLGFGIFFFYTLYYTFYMRKVSLLFTYIDAFFYMQSSFYMSLLMSYALIDSIVKGTAGQDKMTTVRLTSFFTKQGLIKTALDTFIGAFIFLFLKELFGVTNGVTFIEQYIIVKAILWAITKAFSMEVSATNVGSAIIFLNFVMILGKIITFL